MNKSLNDLSKLRREYNHGALLEDEIAANPYSQFKNWFAEVSKTKIIEPNAMTIATADAGGQPSIRTVLLKAFDTEGFVFCTNYQSKKGQQILANPQVALLFYWDELERQVRIEGTATKVSNTDSQNYFEARPHLSQLGALVSAQSSAIPNRKHLEQGFTDLMQEYPENKAIPRPPHWGGFRVTPTLFEFWQGRPNRLHDRIQYTLQENKKWKIERLAP